MPLNLVQRCLGLFGFELVPRHALPVEATEADRRTVARVRPYTMTSAARLWALIQSARYIVQAGIPGDLVECGVWRGGSAMAMAMTLLDCGDADRTIWLYDTFSGMTPPGAFDVEAGSGRSARDTLQRTRKVKGNNVWCIASLDEVRANLQTTGYPASNFRIVAGDVAETLPHYAPDRIGLLRLDTDWYESTAAELAQLYPRLSPGGVCMIDDYGYWRGARRAVDDYFTSHGVHVLLHKIDETGRIFVKPGYFGAKERDPRLI
jgi:hypothetical protein